MVKNMKHLQLTENLYHYLLDHSVKQHPVLQKIQQENSSDELTSIMQIAPEQGQFMAWLVKLLAAKNILEVGTSTGYSSLAMALALPDDGKLITCDINKQATAKAQQYWLDAGVDNKIQLKLAPALESLNSLIEQNRVNHFDLAFIDADKVNYRAYYEACLKLIRPGGVILIDNVLWGGAVADKKDNSNDTAAIRELNKMLANDKRVDISMLPLSDGLTLVRKRHAEISGNANG